jgi:hypothetical protein
VTDHLERKEQRRRKRMKQRKHDVEGEKRRVLLGR